MSDATAVGQSATEMTRVSILTDHIQIDVSLPSFVPVGTLTARVCRLVDQERLKFDGHALATDENATSQHRELSTLEGSRLVAAKTLDQNSVRDGDLLLLRSKDIPQSTPLVDDVIAAVSEFRTETVPQWSERTAQLLALFIAPLLGIVLCGVSYSSADQHTVAFLASFAAGLLVLIAALLIVAARASHSSNSAPLATSITATAQTFAFCIGLLAVPATDTPERLAIAATATTIVSLIAAFTNRTNLAYIIAVVLASAFLALGSLAEMFRDFSLTTLAVTGIIIGIIIIAGAPKIGIAVSNLPIPSVPARGEPLSAADEISTRIVSDLPSVSSTYRDPSEELGKRVLVADQVTTGLIVGAELVSVSSICALAMKSNPERPLPELLFTIAAGLVILLRSRVHIDLVRSAALVLGGTLGLVFVCSISAVSSGNYALMTLALLCAPLVTYITGVWAQHRRFSPVSKRIVEVIDYLLIASLLPLAAWILGIYAFLRGI